MNFKTIIVSAALLAGASYASTDPKNTHTVVAAADTTAHVDEKKATIDPAPINPTEDLDNRSSWTKFSNYCTTPPGVYVVSLSGIAVLALIGGGVYMWKRKSDKQF